MKDPISYNPHTTADEFLLEMLSLGKPIECSLVGVFDEQGRGSRRDIPLPLHRDGDYSTAIAEKHSIDYVGLYCVRDGGNACTTVINGEDKYQFFLQQGQSIIFDNNECLHGREGQVGDRVLLRVWIEKEVK